jgi:hypothetical protein
MTRALAPLLLACAAFGAEPGPPQPFQVTTTQRFDFQPGGAIRIVASYGYLNVEGWDEPKVEVTITKSTDRFYPPSAKEKVTRVFDDIHVTAARPSDNEVDVSTVLPARRGFPFDILPSRRLILTMPKKTARGVTVEYAIQVPRQSNLEIQHDHGYVWIADVKGDIEVKSHTGDIVVMLPDPGPYSIDARTGMGSISSDVAGAGHKEYLVASRFAAPAPPPAHRVLLRMGRGCITVKTGPASGPFWSN